MAGPSVAREELLPGQLPRLDRIRQVVALAAQGLPGERTTVVVDAMLLGEMDDLDGLLPLAREGGGSPVLGCALLRGFGRSVCDPTLGAGHLMALAVGQGQELHDRMVSTVVLRGRP